MRFDYNPQQTHGAKMFRSLKKSEETVPAFERYVGIDYSGAQTPAKEAA